MFRTKPASFPWHGSCQQNVLHGKKWQTMIEAHVDVKTTDCYLFCLFHVAFTKKCSQIRMTSSTQHQHVCQIWKMMEIMTWEVQRNDLKEMVNKLIPDSTGKDVEKTCQSIYLLLRVFVRKVTMLKEPNFELGNLMELHDQGSSYGKPTRDETDAEFEWVDGYEHPIPRICLKFRTLTSCLWGKRRWKLNIFWHPLNCKIYSDFRDVKMWGKGKW